MNERKLQILLVEDNPGDARLFKEMISGDNVSIDNVETLASAIEFSSKNKYDVILLDLGLPDSKGFETFNKLFNKVETVPIIILSGNDDEELGHTIARLGAQDYLVKGKADEYVIRKSIGYSIDRYKSQMRIQQQADQYKDLIRNNTDAMIVLSEDNVVKYFNDAAENILGERSLELIGSAFGEVIPSQFDDTLTILDDSNKVHTLQYRKFEVVWENKKSKVISLRDITDLKLNQDKIEHLNKLLMTIGNINHLIVNEKNKEKLLQRACEMLVEGRAYAWAWIGSFTKDGEIEAVQQSNVNLNIDELLNYIKAGNIPYCLEQVRISDKVVNIKCTKDECGNCPLSDINEDRGGLSVPITYEDKFLGILSVSLESDLLYDAIEDSLLDEVAHDLGLALHTIEVEQKAIQSQRKIKWLTQAISEAANAIVLTDFEGKIEWVNPAFEKLTGYSKAEVLSENPSVLNSGYHTKEFYKTLWDTIKSGNIWKGEITNKRKDGSIYTEEMTITPVTDEVGNITRFIAIKSDITERKNYETNLKEAFEVAEQNAEETAALLDGAKAILESENFEDAARKLYNICCELTGAKSGYVALLSEDGSENEVLFLEAGGMPCSVDENLPMPIRGLRETAYRNAEVVYDNDFMNSKWVKFMPEGHVNLRNVMFSPLTIKGKVEGIMGLANKDGDFTEDDVRIAKGFGELGAIALSDARNKQKLAESEEKYRNIYENATIGIYRSTMDGKILLANSSLLNMFGNISLQDIQNLRTDDIYKNKKDVEEFRRIIKQEGVIHSYESEIIKPNGEEIVIRESAKLYNTKAEGEIIEGVIEDITLEKKAKKELIEARDKAVAMEKVKSEFLAQMSHEIRTPLNSMLNSLTFIEEEFSESKSDDIKDLFGIINSSGDRIINTIQSILNMSELQAGSYEIMQSKFELFNEVIDPVIDKYALELNNKGVKLEVRKPEAPLILNLDIYSMSQIFSNIFDNAVKYTKQGKIQLLIEQNEHQIFLKVVDTGIGISEEYLQKIFEPFSQESQGYSRPYDGCGLGLALVKKYCELNDIDIEIESERGEGTTVSLIISKFSEVANIN